VCCIRIHHQHSFERGKEKLRTERLLFAGIRISALRTESRLQHRGWSKCRFETSHPEFDEKAHYVSAISVRCSSFMTGMEHAIILRSYHLLEDAIQCYIFLQYRDEKAQIWVSYSATFCTLYR
jgi:imidazoleglycerol phosphate synthase glutamine amidotransferase subunit HisH